MRSTGWAWLAIVPVLSVVAFLIWNMSTSSSGWGLVGYYTDGSLTGVRPQTNLVSGTGLAVTGADDSANNRVNYTLAVITPTPTVWTYIFPQPGNINTGTMSAGSPAFVQFPGTIVAVNCGLGTAGTTSSVVIDINYDGTTVYSTQDNRPTLTAGSTYVDATLPDVTAITVSTTATPHYLSVDIDSVDSGDTGANLMCAVRVKP